MYEQFYGLTRSPFALTLDPDLLYPTLQHREALAAIYYAIATQKGLLVFTGEVGTGKTTVLRATMQKLSAIYKDRLQVAIVVNPHLTADDLLDFVMTEIGVPHVPSSKSQRLIRFHEFLLTSRRAGKISAIIVDEAHRLGSDLLEEVRLWTNFETANSKLAQIVLAGQSELNDLLNRQDLRQLKQRIALRVSLNALTAADVRSYLEHRWRKSGGSAFPFTAEAIEALVRLSNGYPRLLNALCDNSLLLGFAEDSRIVGPALVYQAAQDLDLRREGASHIVR